MENNSLAQNVLLQAVEATKLRLQDAELELKRMQEAVLPVVVRIDNAKKEIEILNRALQTLIINGN